MRNFDNRLARLEQTNTAAMDPPPGLDVWVINFGLRSRCLIVDQPGTFQPYLPDFPDLYWRNVATWLNHFKAQQCISAAQIIEEVREYESTHKRPLDKIRSAAYPQGPIEN